MSIYDIRPHHALCMCFFTGKGYSPAFTENMKNIVHELAHPAQEVRIVYGADSICSACPHLKDGVCASGERAAGFDRRTAVSCGFTDGMVISSAELFAAVRGNIIGCGRLSEVCSSCEWYGQICSRM